jgi:hypothetical protein
MRPTSRHSKSLTSAIWLAAGAAAGLIVGVALADRSRAARAVGHRLRGALNTLGGLAGAAERTLSTTGANVEDEAITVAVDDADDLDDLDDADALDEDADDLDGADLPADEPPGLDARVLAAYEQDPVLSRRAIKIDSPDAGTIMLTGHVPNARDIAHAVTIARGTPGVERVEHRLRVRPPRRHASGRASGA